MESRHWCFTINNPTECLDLAEIKDLRYGIYQHEIGEEGTHHFQGYLEFTRSVRLKWMKKHVHPTAHFEKRRGTREQARDYCKKEEGRLVDPVEYGTWIGGQGSRTDVTALKATIDNGASMKDIWDQHPLEFLKFNKGIVHATMLNRPKRTWATEVILLIGPTNTGKTRYAYDHEIDLYKKSPDKWWDGYDGQKAILIDDFYGWLSYHYMLQLLDRYPLNLEYKGGTTPILAERIYITSNKLPADWYKTIDNIDALLRRITKFYFVPELNNYQEYSSYATLENAWNIHPNAFSRLLCSGQNQII